MFKDIDVGVNCEKVNNNDVQIIIDRVLEEKHNNKIDRIKAMGVIIGGLTVAGLLFRGDVGLVATFSKYALGVGFGGLALYTNQQGQVEYRKLNEMLRHCNDLMDQSTTGSANTHESYDDMKNRVDSEYALDKTFNGTVKKDSIYRISQGIITILTASIIASAVSYMEDKGIIDIVDNFDAENILTADQDVIQNQRKFNFTI